MKNTPSTDKLSRGLGLGRIGSEAEGASTKQIL